MLVYQKALVARVWSCWLILHSDLGVKKENEHAVCALGPRRAVPCELHAHPNKMEADLNLMRILMMQDRSAQTPGLPPASSPGKRREEQAGRAPEGFHSLGLQGQRSQGPWGHQRPLLTTPSLPSGLGDTDLSQLPFPTLSQVFTQGQLYQDLAHTGGQC